MSASDADGLATVNLWYRPPGAAKYLPKPMTLSNGKYVVTLDTTADDLRTAGELRYYVLAKDQNASPETTKLPTSAYKAMTVKVCANTGPKITSLAASPSTIYWNPPLGIGCSASASNVTAAVSDVDGLKNVRLHYRFNGGAWQVKPMDSNTVPGKWYANLDTLGDTFPGPSGRIDYYVRAVDKKDLGTNSATKRITIRYCDTDATFSQPSTSDRIVYVPSLAGGYASVYVSISVSDRNVNSANQLNPTLNWQLKNASGVVVLSGKGTGSWDGPYYGTITTTEAWRSALGAKQSGTLIWWLVTRDPYGGTSDSRKDVTTSPTSVQAQ